MKREKSKISKGLPLPKESQTREKSKPEVGDRIKIIFPEKEQEGTLLKTPESEKGIILLKLDSGYNIGFNKKNILDIEVKEKFKEKREEIQIKKDSKKPNIAMIITGGTIASKYDANTGGVKWLDSPENLFKFYPGMFEKVNVSKVEIPFMKGSENMDSKDWKEIAKTVKKLLEDSNIKGVIITHGTDTLHYTSSALSFFLGKLNKPVVLTYAQRSIDRGSSDANLNLQCSAKAAISDIAEVMLVGHSSTNDDFCYAFPGAKVRKLHSSERDAFKVVNGKPIAKIYPDKIEIISNYNKRNKDKINSQINFEEKTALLKFYPGQDPDILDYYVKKGYKGIIIEMFGLGHVGTKESRKSWTNKLKEVINKGLVVCGTAQTIYGRLDPWVYSTGRELQKTGMIFLQDMLSETALVKLGWVLGNKDWNKDKETIKQKMLENISNEFSPRLEK